MSETIDLQAEKEQMIDDIAREVRSLISQGIPETTALLQALEKSIDRIRAYQDAVKKRPCA
jgi:hypothetical protein